MNILIVDDDADILKNIKEILGPFNYNIMTTVSPREGLALLEKNDFDILITDIKMEEMNGFELIKRAKNINQGIEIIVISAYYDQNLVNSLENHDISLFLEKPINIKKFFDKLTEIKNNLT